MDSPEPQIESRQIKQCILRADYRNRNRNLQRQGPSEPQRTATCQAFSRCLNASVPSCLLHRYRHRVGMSTPRYPSLARATFLSKSLSRNFQFHRSPPSWRRCCNCGRRTYSSLSPSDIPRLPFRFETGVALFAKRKPRPFPPPFLSPPSVSFSDPLSTHNRSRDRRAFVNGELIRGQTNGDDAVYASDYFICANDGVGAWAARPRGHAG